MRVYRLEHEKTRRGPYCERHQGAQAITRRVESYDNAGMWAPRHNKRARIAVRTLAQLAQWFDNKTLKALEGEGFVVRVYDAPVLEESSIQVVAVTSRRRPKATFKPSEIIVESELAFRY